MCDIHYEKLLPPLMSGQTLIDRISNYPDYDQNIRNAEQYERLDGLADIYRVYYPFPMSVEIYSKLYLSTTLSLKKKNTKELKILINLACNTTEKRYLQINDR